MGHMDTVSAMPPVAERRGCLGIWETTKGEKGHETYDPNCTYCFIANGGKMD